MHAFFLDTETASLDGGVCDIAIALIDDQFNVVSQVESLIDPERPISPSASGIHHITDDMVWTAPTLAEFMDMQGHPLKSVDWPIFGGHNVGFDIRMLGDHVPAQHRKLDTLKLAKVFWPDADNHQLQTLRYMFLLEAGPAHRAMGDVITGISLLRHMAAEFGHDMQGLMEVMKAPLSLDTKLTFGKHRGMKLRDIPLSYIRWMVEKSDMDLDPDLKAALLSRLD